MIRAASTRGIARFALVAFSVAGCVAPAPEGPAFGERHAALVNGQPDTGHPAVGILHAGEIAACTATLIGTRTVLTAAHCVLTENPPYQPLQPVRFIVGSLWGTMYGAAAVATHPNYAGGNKSDIAVVQLSKDVSGVTPMPIASTAPVKYEPITIVGYGRPAATSDEFGTKRKGTNVIDTVATTLITFDGSTGQATTCQGDSGGPTLALRGGAETVIGVHSTGSQGCTDIGTDTRVDAYGSWVAAQMTKGVYGSMCQAPTDCVSGLCLNTGAGASCSQPCPCPYGDSCVGVSGGGSVTQACVPNSGTGPKALGDTCTTHLDCDSQICIPVPTKGSLCSEQCDTAQKNCPTGFFCIPTQDGGTLGLCIPGGDKHLGETCTDALDCDTLICVAVPAKGNLCAKECTPGGNNCPTDYYCAVTTSGEGLCVPKGTVAPPDPPPPPPPPVTPPPPPTAELGDPCTKGSECKSGICAPTAAGTVCVALCDRTDPASCPAGFSCAPVAGRSEGACVRSGTEPPPPAELGVLGDPCGAHEDCASGLCAGIGEESLCTELCEPSAGCAEGFECLSAGPEQSVCVPAAPAPAPAADGESSSGCGVGRGPAPSATTLLLLALLLLARSRRRA